MNEGGDNQNGEDDRAEGDAVGGSEDRGMGGDESEPDGSWSAAAPTASDGEIPLPWTVVDEDELDEDVPETFEELRFIGPKTAEALRDSAIGVEDITRKRISYRDLTEQGVHPGVAAKIRREHSLSWSFDSTDSDLSRRSSQVRGLDDEERAWVAASSGWAEDDAPAETDGSGDATNAESEWQTQSAEFEADGDSDEASPTDGESAWRATAQASADGNEDPTRDEEVEWRKKATEADADDAETTGEAAWRERATESVRDDTASDSVRGDDESDVFTTEAEAEWREQSAPTPVTVLGGVDDTHADRLADAGIRSVRRLATADPESVADALELDQRRVERWCEAARASFD
ncbi:hypothetical protein C499_07930 [Halogeometricum borinquense DSM 11551]|uniref:DUF7409 domain-containing protein n=1 Tax=Halogeometricum borinquense (strain ATCC 700274 / DSM 11551 / JCM 10706 / KCTC 4070 / PR3) TaxID=469382 RepID=E4NMV0_HALBP|nr:helix-hairpin-helix domain-containing protein [Halogeometricum borinquense]ADQ67362.1 hypothetical protein Hbor_17940 [Halogeometricum borinquense DSM 11551]ELY28575.1 hypothetical protein C499_07930 [Halogeometricum borinquense DSM 11551]